MGLEENVRQKQAAVDSLKKSLEAAKKANAGLSVEMGIKEQISGRPTPQPETPLQSGSSGTGSSQGISGGGTTSSSTSGGYYAKPNITETDRRMKELYNYGQLGLMERTWFEQKVLPKFPISVGYLEYGATGITQDKDKGFFKLYDKPTLPYDSESVRVYNTGDLYDMYDMTPYGALQAFGGSQGTLNKSEFKGDIEKTNKSYGGQIYDPDLGTLEYDKVKRYGVALGPHLQNPDLALIPGEGVNVSDMKYGTCVDVAIALNGKKYYIPAIIVDVKYHSSPDGVFQTGVDFFGNDVEMDEDKKGNIVEWYTQPTINGKNKSLGLGKFNKDTDIIIYVNERMYYPEEN